MGQRDGRSLVMERGRGRMVVMVVGHLDHPQSRVARSDGGRVVLYNMMLLLLVVVALLLLMLLLLFCNRRDRDGRQRRRVSHRGRERHHRRRGRQFSRRRCRQSIGGDGRGRRGDGRRCGHPLRGGGRVVHLDNQAHVVTSTSSSSLPPPSVPRFLGVALVERLDLVLRFV